MKKTYNQQPCGVSNVLSDGSGIRIKRVSMWILDTLPSFRDRIFYGKTQKISYIKLQKERERWFEKILSLGVRQSIWNLQRECALNGVKMRMSVVVYRRIPIRDRKNYIASFDHIFLDGFQKMGWIYNDQDNNIDWHIHQEKPDDMFKGKDYLFITMRPSRSKCVKSITTKAKNERSKFILKRKYVPKNRDTEPLE